MLDLAFLSGKYLRILILEERLKGSESLKTCSRRPRRVEESMGFWGFGVKWEGFRGLEGTGWRTRALTGDYPFSDPK